MYNPDYYIAQLVERLFSSASKLLYGLLLYFRHYLLFSKTKYKIGRKGTPCGQSHIQLMPPLFFYFHTIYLEVLECMQQVEIKQITTKISLLKLFCFAHFSTYLVKLLESVQLCTVQNRSLKIKVKERGHELYVTLATVNGPCPDFEIS